MNHPARRPLVIGHRGAKALAPENTLASFRRALDDGADWVEFDVRFSRDGRPVVIHDATVERTTDGRGEVDAHDAAALSRLDAGGWFSPEYAGERIPSLAEALGLLAGRAGADVEIKDTSRDVASGVRCVLDELARAGVEQYLVSSFRPEIVTEIVRQGAPGGLVVSRGWTDPAERARQSGAKVLVLKAARATAHRIRAARRLGLSVWTYSVDDRETFDRAARLGFDALIGSDPHALRQWCGDRAEGP